MGGWWWRNNSVSEGTVFQCKRPPSRKRTPERAIYWHQKRGLTITNQRYSIRQATIKFWSPSMPTASVDKSRSAKEGILQSSERPTLAYKICWSYRPTKFIPKAHIIKLFVNFFGRSNRHGLRSYPPLTEVRWISALRNSRSSLSEGKCLKA